jgi:hypothetical protein
MQYYGYPHGVLWTPACITLSSRMGLSEHCMGTQTGYCASSHRALNAPTSVLLVITEGIVRARWSLQEGGTRSNRPSWQ